MFSVLILIALLVVLASSIGMLYRVTYPDTCAARRCDEHAAA